MRLLMNYSVNILKIITLKIKSADNYKYYAIEVLLNLLVVGVIANYIKRFSLKRSGLGCPLLLRYTSAINASLSSHKGKRAVATRRS